MLLKIQSRKWWLGKLLTALLGVFNIIVMFIMYSYNKKILSVLFLVFALPALCMAVEIAESSATPSGYPAECYTPNWVAFFVGPDEPVFTLVCKTKSGHIICLGQLFGGITDTLFKQVSQYNESNAHNPITNCVDSNGVSY